MPTLDIVYTVDITGALTNTEGDLTDVVRQVQWNYTGTAMGQSFTLPQTTDLPAPGEAGFIPYDELTQEIMTQWVLDNTPNLPAIQGHIAQVLPQMIYTSELQPTPLPWAPPEPTPPEPTPAP